MAQITPEEANRRNELGGALLCLDVPEGVEFGIDTHAWRVGPRFSGIKMIPPGVHFVFTASTDKYGEMAPRTGFFLVLDKRDVDVRRWSTTDECLSADDKAIDADEAERYRLGVRRHDFDASMGPYPWTDDRNWLNLTSHITRDLIKRLRPRGGVTTTSTQALTAEEEAMLARADAARQADLQRAHVTGQAPEETDDIPVVVTAAGPNPSVLDAAADPTRSVLLVDDTLVSNAAGGTQGVGAGVQPAVPASAHPNSDARRAARGPVIMRGRGRGRGGSRGGTDEGETQAQAAAELDYADPSAAARYTRIDLRQDLRRVVNGKGGGEDITAIALDRTPMFDRLVADRFKGAAADVLGEMQYAFISFMIGQSYEGFEQWKRLLILLCGCGRAISEGRKPFVAVIDTVIEQLQNLPDDFTVGQNNHETNFLLTALRALLDAMPPSMEKARRMLGLVVNARFGWDLDGDFDDEAPVIVEDDG